MNAEGRLLIVIANLAMIIGVGIALESIEFSGSLLIENGIQEIESFEPENEPFLQLNGYANGFYGSSKEITGSERAIFGQQYSSYPYVVASPAQGAPPLQTTLQAMGIEGTPFSFWQIDWDGNGAVDTMGQGMPLVQVTYPSPGTYFPIFYFYNERNESIVQAKGAITVTSQDSSAQVQNISTYQAPFQTLGQGGFQIPESGNDNGTEQVGSQSHALTASPGGWGIVRDTTGSDKSRTVKNLSDQPDSWSPPTEEFTEFLRPELYASAERGPAPLTVSFDANKTYSRYGVMRYNYDVAWGPHEAEDDGYYLYSGTNPLWTHTFDEYGMYLVILDVEDNLGKKSRITKVIFVL